MTVLVLMFVFLFVSAFGSYRAYEFTDSVTFCGQLCHAVMKPEFVAYQASAHARVKCVECHVGSGASFYVKSKLSGAYQVYAVTFGKFPRPIPTPMPMPSMTAPGGTYPGGGPGGPRSTTTLSGGGLRFGEDFSTRLGGGDISTFFISTFY